MLLVAHQPVPQLRVRECCGRKSPKSRSRTPVRPGEGQRGCACTTMRSPNYILSIIWCYLSHSTNRMLVIAQTRRVCLDHPNILRVYNCVPFHQKPHSCSFLYHHHRRWWLRDLKGFSRRSVLYGCWGWATGDITSRSGPV